MTKYNLNRFTDFTLKTTNCLFSTIITFAYYDNSICDNEQLTWLNEQKEFVYELTKDLVYWNENE